MKDSRENEGAKTRSRAGMISTLRLAGMWRGWVRALSKLSVYWDFAPIHVETGEITCACGVCDI